MKNVALVGVGAHAKRIYMNFFKKHKINLALVVELASQKDITMRYLDENGFNTTEIFIIDDSLKDNNYLPIEIFNKLKLKCDELQITHLIISTEPKSHFMYLNFALKNNINVLTDKPITVSKNMTSLSSIEKIRKQYYEILELAKTSKGSCKVMCQRQYHRGYEKIKELLIQVVDKFKMPITNIDIFHSDGAWEMPHDMEKENHPYKYGYGKLFHSGYHFIDLLSDFIKINDSLSDNKKIVYGDVYSKVFTPNDEMNILNVSDYKRIFKNQDIPDYYEKNDKPTFDYYGEKDYHGLLSFYNKDGFTITTANLNLLHNGVSRRAWIKTKDFYKQNGRIRHERINIEIGHLFNIQVHSYQSKEISDRTNDEENVGGLEHFDIFIFSNPLVDKVPFKKISLGDMYTDEEKKEFLGYNELSREIFIEKFLNNEDCKGDIRDQALAIEILYSCAKGIHNYYSKVNKIETIDIRNDYTYRFIAKRLKNYSKIVDRDLEKKEIYSSMYYNDIYTLYAFERYIPQKNCYEVFISIDDTKDVAGGLLSKTFKNKKSAYLYFKYLEYVIRNKKVSLIEKMVENY